MSEKWHQHFFVSDASSIFVECFLSHQLLEVVRPILTSCPPQTAGVKKSLSTASKSDECCLIAKWTQPAVNHLYWCAAASRGNADLLVDAWTSMTRHVVNIHTDHPGIYTRCFHEPITDGEWLVPGQ